MVDITGIGTLAEAATSIIGKFFPDKTQEEKDKLTFELQSMMNEYNLIKGQTDINLAEAQSTDRLQHWRGALGWVCVAAYAWEFVIAPFVSYLVNILAAVWGIALPQLPTIDVMSLSGLTMGMLGLGMMHTYQTVKGAT